MDSTLISQRPGKEACSLNRARRAAWGSFAGAVVDWYDFLLYGITAALVFNREFFPQISPAMPASAYCLPLTRLAGGRRFCWSCCAPSRVLRWAVNGAARRCWR